MRTAATKIHFAFDLWTGANRRSYFGMTGHWIDSNEVEQDIVLALERMTGPDSHSGESQAAAFWKVAKQYEIERLIGSFTLDNASNNDTAVRAISRLARRIGVVFDASVHRIRCFGHIINLVVKAFLYGESLINLELELERILSEDGFDNEQYMTVEEAHESFIKWKEQGPLGRLRNLLVYIRRSPQRLDRFKGILLELYPDKPNQSSIPIVGNTTRWGSDYNSLAWALGRREALDEYLLTELELSNRSNTDNTKLTADDGLNGEDWLVIQDIMNILSPLKEATLRFEQAKSNGCLADILPTLEELLTIFETAKTVYKSNLIISTMLVNGWDVLNKYYSLSDETPLYCAAVALHPQYKLQHLQDVWESKEGWYENARRLVRNLWETEYKGNDTISTTQTVNIEGSSVEAATDESMNPLIASLRAKKYKRSIQTSGLDAFDAFQNTTIVWDAEGDDRHRVLQFWFRKYKNEESSKEERQLARMALEILSIPAMSASPERLFSSANLTLSDSRCRLGDHVVRALECLKSWSRSNLVNQEALG